MIQKIGYNLFSYAILLSFLLFLSLNELQEDFLKDALSLGVNIDLKEPVFTEGALTTDKGGVITASNIRIQAERMVYRLKTADCKPNTIEAEGALVVEYGDYLLIGRKIEYNFETKTGILYDAITGDDPWYFGGEEIELLSDGSVFLKEGYFTTSDRDIPSWRIEMQNVILTQKNDLTAKNIRFKVRDTTVLWFPLLFVNLDWIRDTPIRFRIRYSKEEELRFGIIYEMIAWERFKTYLRMDYRSNRGPGFGISTEYISPWLNETFETINYIARDSSSEEPSERTRYRFSGIYENHLLDDHLQIDFTYDKVSDKEMPTDYAERGLELETALRTRLDVRYQWDELLISNLTTELRVNTFQSELQQLPTLAVNFHPRNIGSTGIVCDNEFKIGYLDFQYAKNLIGVQNYHSTRCEYNLNLYRPIITGPFTLTPSFGTLLIHYGSSPERNDQLLSLFTIGLDAQTKLYKEWGFCRHVIEPYINYKLITQPTSLPEDHFIFDINDGWFRLDTMRIGTRNLLYFKKICSLFRNLSIDTYTYAFFNTHTFPKTCPYIYTDLNWYSAPNIRHTLGSAWDVQRGGIGHFNLLTEVTLNTAFAFAVEYRHRNRYAWRKLEYNNFILDAFLSEQVLVNTALSDRRDTLLFDSFYRFAPDWSLHFQMRHGWNRIDEPNYTEYEVELITKWLRSWEFRLSYQFTENYKSTFGFHFSFGLDKP